MGSLSTLSESTGEETRLNGVGIVDDDDASAVVVWILWVGG